MKRACLLIFFLWTLIAFMIPTEVVALEYCGYHVTEIPVPEEYQILVSSECSMHRNFQSAAANEEGVVAIYSRNTDAGYGEVYDHRKYIDLFDSNGEFVLEIQFSTSLSVDIELTKDELIIYFHINILTYDLDKGTFHYYELPSGVNLAHDYLPTLRKKSLDIGSWNYSLEKELDGYKSISRMNVRTGEEQTIMSCVGSGRSPLNTIFIPTGVSICMLLWRIACRKKRSNG